MKWPLSKLTANSAQEAEWQEIFLNNTEIYLPGFKYLWEFEWEPVPGRPDLGKNDLIMTDGYGIFAVVEVKLIHNDDDVINNKRIKKVTEQARKYKDWFIKENKGNSKVLGVIGVSFTNQKNGTVQFLEEYDLSVASAIANKLETENYFNNIMDDLIQSSEIESTENKDAEITRLNLIITRYKKEVQRLNEKIQKQVEQEKKSKAERENSESTSTNAQEIITKYKKVIQQLNEKLKAKNQEITRLNLVTTRYKKEVQQLNGKIQKKAELEKKPKAERADTENFSTQKRKQDLQKEIDKLEAELHQIRISLIDKHKNEPDENEMKEIQDQNSLLEEAQQEIEKMKEREIRYENTLVNQQNLNKKLTESMDKEIELKVKMEIGQKEAEIKSRLEWEHERQKEEQ
ncbi:9619_t:CDS:2 [Ambispora gerdemannii]|uniref:9619_t:CDS:1 n=1 Tax=Ambispora gerdemannii TaxID=144530 RepID=A0A9N9BMH3_9GLOM|nr:9619_t:CDS:2 [Ambispora gerdemannii]